MMNIFARRLLAAVLLVVLLAGLSAGLGWLSLAESQGQPVRPSQLFEKVFTADLWNHAPGRPFPFRTFWTVAAAAVSGGVLVVLHTVCVARLKMSYLVLTQSLVASMVLAWMIGALMDLQFSGHSWAADIGVRVPVYLMFLAALCSAWELLRLTVLCRVLKDAATEL